MDSISDNGWDDDDYGDDFDNIWIKDGDNDNDSEL